MCCGQWVAFPSPAQIAAVPAQALQLQLLANGPRGLSTKQATEEKVRRDNLDGETAPMEGSHLESERELANFLVVKH